MEIEAIFREFRRKNPEIIAIYLQTNLVDMGRLLVNSGPQNY